MIIKKAKKIILDYNLLSLLIIPLFIFRIFKINRKKIIVLNYSGKGYGDNGKYIVEQLLKSNNNYKIYWAINDNKFIKTLPNTIMPVRYNSLKYFYHLYTSKVWINNCRFPSYIRKRKNQYYIQTWHSSIRLKKIEKDAERFLSKEYIRSAKNDSKMIDLLLCGCDFSRRTYEKSFWYDGKIAMTGTPKFDPYFSAKDSSNIKKKILKKYCIDSDKKIILYAPTFRKNNKGFLGTLDCKSLLSNNKMKDYVILLRLHPNSNAIINEKSGIINVTDYHNIQDLVITCDYLITDYSGCCFDALVNGKKCALFVPDLEEYKKNDRELYFTFDELPFPKISNINDLIKFLNKKDYLDYDKKIITFRENIGLIEDGNASLRVKNIISNVVEGVDENEKI